MKRLIIGAYLALIILVGAYASPEPPDDVAQAAQATDIGATANEKSAEDMSAGLLSAQKKLVAITFDDGPGNYTGQLLDELAKRDAKATFFVFARNITEDSAPLIKRMADEGHCVASHTYNHARLTTLSNSQILKEVEKADEAIFKVTGTVPQLIRPPFGAYNQRVIDAVGKPLILWSVDTRDWQLHDSRAVCDNILGCVKDGDIVLLHDMQSTSKDGVIAAIDSMLDDGFSFVTVPELFAQRGIALEAGKRYYKAAARSSEDSPEEVVVNES